MKVGDLVEWNLHSICPKALVIGFNGSLAHLLWLPGQQFGKISYVGKRELKVINESR